MDRESAKQEIKTLVSCLDYLEKSKAGNYICPFCGSGTGPHKSGALQYYPDTNTFYCHACGRHGDPIDLYMNEKQINNFSEAISLLAEENGIYIDRKSTAAEDFAALDKEAAGMNSSTTRAAAGGPQVGHSGSGYTNTPAANNAAYNQNSSGSEADYSSYYEYCRQYLNDPAAVEYLQKRGIDIKTAEACGIGYDPAADPANAPGATGETYKPHPAPRLILPTSKSHYVGRRIDGIEGHEKLNPKGGSPGIFNAGALYDQEVQAVYVVEGIFDALSIIEAGYNAIALNSSSNGKILINLLRQRPTEATLILCPDNDKDPQIAEKVKAKFKELAAELRRLNISNIQAEINGEYTDANEHLTGNKETFSRALSEAYHKTAARPDNTSYYLNVLFDSDIRRFKSDIKTGFPALDEQARGLHTGLYIIAAVPSLGKTSFCLQMADQLAAAGHHVLFFSLEQSRLELVSKSLARNMVKFKNGEPDFSSAFNSLAIRENRAPESELLKAAGKYIESVDERLSIIEGNFNCDISFIGEYTRQYIRRNNARPVLFIDYLQILRLTGETKYKTAKEKVDELTTELKRLSTEISMPIIAISSINRMNYLMPIDFESLKESGGIEYGADAVFGMNLRVLATEEIFEKDGGTAAKRKAVQIAKRANPRKIELTCLKTRFGPPGFSCYYNYYPAHDLFVEDSAADADFLICYDDDEEEVKTI